MIDLQPKCQNYLCFQRQNQLHRVKSKYGKQYLSFCDRCYKKYLNGSFCDFCDQIYSNSNKLLMDDKDWIQCDHCQKWNHLDCEVKNRNDKIYQQKDDLPYFCMACNNRSESNKEKSDCDPYIYEYKSHKVRKYPIEDSDQCRQIKKEKNITLSASKDNKIQMSKAMEFKIKQNLAIRINLLEEEVQDDLQELRIKKVCESSHESGNVKSDDWDDLFIQQISQQNMIGEIRKKRQFNKVSSRNTKDNVIFQ